MTEYDLLFSVVCLSFNGTSALCFDVLRRIRRKVNHRTINAIAGILDGVRQRNSCLSVSCVMN